MGRCTHLLQTKGSRVAIAKRLNSKTAEERKVDYTYKREGFEK